MCDACHSTLRPSPPTVVAGVPAEAAFRHVGAAAVLVRRLKYQRNLAAGRFLATAMVPCLPADARCLVPTPRAPLRIVRHGIDPAAFLAEALSEATGLPVVHALAAPVWSRRRAGAPRRVRRPVSFTLRMPCPAAAVLVDDVRTTGSTIASAIDALEGIDLSVVTATAAGTMESGAVTGRTQEVALRRSDTASQFGPPMRQIPTLPPTEPHPTTSAASRFPREEDG
jgi:predicted amidophosphoribosyltransferase